MAQTLRAWAGRFRFCARKFALWKWKFALMVPSLAFVKPKRVFRAGRFHSCAGKFGLWEWKCAFHVPKFAFDEPNIHSCVPNFHF